VNTLQFIDAMTGRLAWPLAAVILGLLFRTSVAALLGRLRKAVWGDKQAEFGAINSATREVEQSIQKAALPDSAGADGNDAARRERMDRLMRDAAGWGFQLARAFSGAQSMPEFDIEWVDDHARVTISPSPKNLSRLLPEMDDAHHAHLAALIKSQKEST
jgi:hypothetical protein